MDKITIDLLSIVIGGSGIFKIFTEFNHPNVHATFLGQNPYSIKKYWLETIPSYFFLFLTLSALFLQAIEAIFSDRISERIYTTHFYLIFIFLLLVAVWVLLVIFKKISKFIALKKILPYQIEVYWSAIEIIENDGWRNDQLTAKESISNPEKHLESNWKTAEQRIGQIEELLDKKRKGDLRERAEKLRKYFKNSQGPK